MEDSEKTRGSPNEVIVRIVIHYCEKLKSEVLLTRPILCLHVIDGNHGTYVKKSDRNRAVMSFYENQRTDMDYIMPIMTQPSTIQGQKLHIISWEEAFILNEKFDYFIKKESNIILFFEIVDLIPLSGTKHQYERLNQNGMQKIAWAFLKILGSNGVVNTGSKLRLQLYKPCTRLKKTGLFKLEVYHWWSKLKRVPLPASLYVTIEPFVAFTAEPTLRSMLPMQEEIGSSNTESLSGKLQESATCVSESSKSSADNIDFEVAWQRKMGEPCKVPTKLSLTLETTNKCHLIKFSSSGRMLSIGCGGQGHYYIFIYGIPHGKLIKKELAHSELIYDLDWSKNDSYLLSASGDYSVKLWNAKSWNMKASFIHPSFVYAAKFHPLCENILATACYDHIVRLWTFNKFSQLLKELEAHISSVYCISWHENGRTLFSTDCSGHIKLWKIPSKETICNKSNYDACKLENELDFGEAKGISISKIIPVFSKNTVYLLCSDSAVRRLDLFSREISVIYKSCSPRNVLKGCGSPCGNLLFLCCDDGVISVWDQNKCKIAANVTNNLPSRNVSCLDYHPYDHMLAVSFWEDGMPMHIYVYSESDASKMQQEVIEQLDEKNENATPDAPNHSLKEKTRDSKFEKKSIKNIQNQKDILGRDIVFKPDKASKKYMYETEETIEESSETISSVESKFDEITIDSGSSRKKMPKDSERRKREKQPVAAAITKSSQFDSLAVTDNFSHLDSEAKRNHSSESDIPSSFQRSSKRSQRRKRLRELYKQ